MDACTKKYGFMNVKFPWLQSHPFSQPCWNFFKGWIFSALVVGKLDYFRKNRSNLCVIHDSTLNGRLSVQICPFLTVTTSEKSTSCTLRKIGPYNVFWPIGTTPRPVCTKIFRLVAPLSRGMVNKSSGKISDPGALRYLT